jgi:Spy/CpxP family protein refolding chaperone
LKQKKGDINMNRKLVSILAVITVVGIGTLAYAHWNEDWGHHGWMHGGGGGYGYGMPHGYYGNQGYGDLNDEQITALDKERAAFFKETANIREDLYAKQLALQSELSKSDPDTAKASELQKDISELERKLDQKRIDHMIKMKKISPNGGRGFAMMGGPMMGGPMMGGHMMGYGSRYSGDCWQ